MMRRLAKTWGISLLIIAMMGWLKFKPEQQFRQELLAQNLTLDYPNTSMMENLGQVGFMAALGGYRSVIASFIYLQAETSFENTQWDQLELQYKLITRLHPHMARYWELGSWHLAYNAASYYLYRAEIPEFKRASLYKKWVGKGVAFLEPGLVYCAREYRLFAQMGEIYRERVKDKHKSVEYYLKAVALGGPEYMERVAAYQMATFDDRASWEKAYEILMRHYNSGRPKTASMYRDIPVLEEKLGIPQNQRITRPQPRGK